MTTSTLFLLTVAAVATPVHLGPLPFGPDLAQVQAALPAANWEVLARSEYSGRPFSLRARDAMEFGGRRVTVEARADKYSWSLTLNGYTAEADAAACQSAATTFFTALEGAVGTLQGDPEPNAAIVPFGQGSTMILNARDERDRLIPPARIARSRPSRLGMAVEREVDNFVTKAYAAYDSGNPQNCVASVTLNGWRDQPPPDVMPYDETRVIRRLPIGEQHRLASTLTGLPPAGYVVPMQCRVSRQSGKVLTCFVRDESVAPPEVIAVAGRYAGGMAFDTSAYDRDDPRELLVDVPVRVAPGDVRSLEFGGPVVPLQRIVFAEQPSAKEVNYAYPIRALRAGIGAGVDLTCEVQADGSLICRPPVVRVSAGADAPAALVPDFENAADRLVPQYRVAPQLADGKPSAGAVFQLTLAFATQG